MAMAFGWNSWQIDCTLLPISSNACFHEICSQVEPFRFIGNFSRSGELYICCCFNPFGQANPSVPRWFLSGRIETIWLFSVLISSPQRTSQIRQNVWFTGIGKIEWWGMTNDKWRMTNDKWRITNYDFSNSNLFWYHLAIMLFVIRLLSFVIFLEYFCNWKCVTFSIYNS